MENSKNKPIFIVAFARGGSGILLNVLRSHPLVCSPTGELQEVIYGKRYTHESVLRIMEKRLQSKKLLKSLGPDYFSIENWKPRTQSFSDENEVLLSRIFDREISDYPLRPLNARIAY